VVWPEKEVKQTATKPKIKPLGISGTEGLLVHK
jgi:hypothetical protein